MAHSKGKNTTLTRRQIARREKEARQQKLLILMAAVVGVIVVTIIVVGAIVETTKARRPVARVDDVMITTTDFKARQYYERWMTRLQIYSYQELLNQLQVENTEVEEEGDETPVESANNAYIEQLQLSISNLESQLSEDLSSLFAGQVLDSMIEEKLVRQEANKRSLSVSEQDIDRTIEEFMGFGASSVAVTDTVATPDPQEIEDTFQQFKTNVLEPSRFSEDDFRVMIETGLLREELKELISQDVEIEQDQVQVTLFSVSSEEAGTTLASRINDDNEEISALITELAEDEDDNSYGYEVSWLPTGYLGTQLSIDIERIAFNTPVGRASEPVLGPGDVYYVIYVNGHEVRPLSDEILYQKQEQEYSDWLSEQRDERTEYLAWEEAVLTRP